MGDVTCGWAYYKCHRVVQAVEIVSMRIEGDGTASVQTTASPMTFTKEFIQKHLPIPGSFLISDSIGRLSSVDREEFLEGYTLIEEKTATEIERLRKELERAEHEVAEWQTRYEDLRDSIKNLVD